MGWQDDPVVPLTPQNTWQKDPPLTELKALNYGPIVGEHHHDAMVGSHDNPLTPEDIAVSPGQLNAKTGLKEGGWADVYDQSGKWLAKRRIGDLSYIKPGQPTKATAEFRDEIRTGKVFLSPSPPPTHSWSNDPVVTSSTEEEDKPLEPPQAPIIPKSGMQEDISEARQIMETPRSRAAGLPRGTGDEPLIQIPQIPQQEGTMAQIGAGLVNTASGIAQSVETPQFAATLPFAASRPMQAIYSIQALKDIPEALRQFTAPDKSLQQRIEAGGRGVADVVFGTMMGLGAIKPRGAIGPSERPIDISEIPHSDREIPQVNSPPLEGTAWYDQDGNLVNVGHETDTPLNKIGEPVVEAQTGVANRYLDEATQRGEIPKIESLNGITYDQSIKIGNSLRKSRTNPGGADPYLLAKKVKTSGAISPSDFFVMRAEYHDLAMKAKAAAAKAELNPLDKTLGVQMEEARAAQVDFLRNGIQIAKNAWHKLGMGMQGEAPVNYGTFEGQREAFLQALGREPNKYERATLKRGAERVRKAKIEESDARKEQGKAIDKELGKPKIGEEQRLKFEIEKMMRELMPC